RMGHLEASTTELTSKLDLIEREAVNLRRESAARDRIVGELELGMERLQQNFHHHLQEQVEQLRNEVAEAHTRILTALEESRRAHENEQSRTPVPVTAWPAARKKIDRQQYREMIERVRRAVASAVPANATVAVASKGDPELLQLQGRKGWHFPQNDDGTYT